MTTDLDHAISSAISDLVAAAPEPLDTPSIATITGRPVSRRPRLLLATAASAAIIGGGVAVLGLRGGSPDELAGAGTSDAAWATAPAVAADRPGPVHIVQVGETWASIAADEGLTVDLLLEFNGLTTAELALTGETVDTPLDAGTAVSLARVGSVTDTTVPTTP